MLLLMKNRVFFVVVVGIIIFGDVGAFAWIDGGDSGGLVGLFSDGFWEGLL